MVFRAKNDAAKSDAPVILGCVIDHEIGHLLLGPNGHSLAGIMQSQWEPKQIRQATMGTVLFTSAQSKFMRAQVQAHTRPRTAAPPQANVDPKDPQMLVQGSSEEELCVTCEGLFVPQRDHGIHTGGAACGNVAGRQRSKREHRGDADIRERITGTYTE